MRTRPNWHFTAKQGWTNDPHGVIFYGGKYHMFYQYNPQAITWNEACHWGHAISDDLRNWVELPIALTPQNEIGCWSGSAVVNGEDVVILYTSIRHDDWGLGAVAIAASSGDLEIWDRIEMPDVIPGPPLNMAITAFRDPFVWKDNFGWKAVLGAGIIGFGGTVLQYSSADLVNWHFDGEVASRSNEELEPLWTGKVWECPQLIDLGDKWLLAVSVWEDDVLHYVAYSLGSYDGLKFSPGEWRRLTYGSSAYATTIFRDQEQRPVIMSWLRETNNQAPKGSPWASSMSLPFELELVGDELVIHHHRNYFKTEFFEFNNFANTKGPFVLTAELNVGTSIVLKGTTTTLDFQASQKALQIFNEEGMLLLELPNSRIEFPSFVELSIDADILEVVWSRCSGVGAVRVQESDEYQVILNGATQAKIYE